MPSHAPPIRTDGHGSAALCEGEGSAAAEAHDAAEQPAPEASEEATLDPGEVAMNLEEELANIIEAAAGEEMGYDDDDEENDYLKDCKADAAEDAAQRSELTTLQSKPVEEQSLDEMETTFVQSAMNGEIGLGIISAEELGAEAAMNMSGFDDDASTDAASAAAEASTDAAAAAATGGDDDLFADLT